MSALIIYEGYTLYESGRSYKSLINDEWRQFDTASQWKKYIDLLMKKK